MMEGKDGRKAAALFDLDGVVFDTEPQYTVFWGGMGRLYQQKYVSSGKIYACPLVANLYGSKGSFESLASYDNFYDVSRINDNLSDLACRRSRCVNRTAGLLIGKTSNRYTANS